MSEKALAVAVLHRALADLADAMAGEAWPACEAHKFLQGTGEWAASRAFWAAAAGLDGDALKDAISTRLARVHHGERQQVQRELRAERPEDAGQAVGRTRGQEVTP